MAVAGNQIGVAHEIKAELFILPREFRFIHAEQGDDFAGDAAHGQEGAECDFSVEERFARGGAFQRGGEQGADDGIGNWKFLASCRFHRFFENLESLSKGGVIGGGIFIWQEEIGSHGEKKLLPFGGGPAIGADRCRFIRIMEKGFDEFQK